MKINLHANFPQIQKIPNAAIGYLKSYLAQNDSLQIKNIYWYLLPPELQLELDQLYSLFIRSPNNPIHIPNMTLHPWSYIAKYMYPRDFSSQKILNVSPIEYLPFFSKDTLRDFAFHFTTFIDESIDEKKMNDVDVAGFTMNLYQWIFNYYVLLKIKKNNPDMKTVLGGFRRADQAFAFMKIFTEADFAIWGEGEIPFSRLLQQINDSSTYNEIPNLIYRKEKDLITTNQITVNDLPDINTYPFADHTDYFNTKNELHLDLSSYIPIYSNHSCSWDRCKFCVSGDGIDYREKKPEKIVEEIEYQTQKYDQYDITFTDDNIGPKQRKDFDFLLDLLLQSSKRSKRPYQIRRCELFVSRVDADSIEKMKKLGFESVQIGFEATSDSLLKKMMKPQRFAHNIQVLKQAGEQGFPLIGLNIMQGIPDEHPDDVLESIKNIRFLRYSLNRYSLVPTIFILYSGTTYFEEMSSEERKQKWTYSPIFNELQSLDFLKSENKYNLLGFIQNGLSNSHLWEMFKLVMEQYKTMEYSYKWYDSDDGSSVVEEYARQYDTPGQYFLDPIETQILLFCNSVRTLSDVENHFPTVEKHTLFKKFSELKEAGFLYFNEQLCDLFISVLSIKNKLPKEEFCGEKK